MAASFPDQLLAAAGLPPEVDAEALRAEWLALRPPLAVEDRHPPLPVWARRPLAEAGPAAWQILRHDVPGIDAARPECVYVHVPFCAERCHFCDCYSFRLASHREQHVAGYVELLATEIRAWSRLGSLGRRPVTTVHLGGGTPTVLGLPALERLVALCREHLAVSPATEWALESTISDLSPPMLAGLEALGFRRLHVGVQSLDDGVRRALNRRAPAAEVLARLGQALARGWVVSVDLILGLPGQTLAGLLDDVRTLAAAGIDGFSLYELQLSSRNRAFARQHGLRQRDRRLNYLANQAASRLMLALGYRQTLFNHFASARDANLYFTFPERGEDLLALGTIADGVLGDYHYRHPPYAAYCRTLSAGMPGLQGGLRRNDAENRLQPLVTALMGGRVPRPLVEALVPPALAGLWLEARLLAPAPGGETLNLTPSGSWFVGNMIDQLLRPIATGGQNAHGAGGGP